MYGVSTDELAIGTGFESCASTLAMVSWNSDVPVTVRTPLPAREMPTRNRLVEWLVAASVAVLLVGGGALLQKRDTSRNVATVDTAVVDQSPLPGVVVAPPPTMPVARHTPALSLAADVHELSDGNLQQLMDEMEKFDALPNSEPEPVFAVDMSEGR